MRFLILFMTSDLKNHRMYTEDRETFGVMLEILHKDKRMTQLEGFEQQHGTGAYVRLWPTIAP